MAIFKPREPKSQGKELTVVWSILLRVLTVQGRRLPAESDPKSPDAEVATETNNANSELIANFEQQQLNLKGATRPRAYARRLVYVLYTMVFLHWLN